MKNIVVLGGSYLQSFFIKNAVSSNKVFVLDGNQNCYASKNNLGIFFNIDFSEINKVREFCIKYKIDSIIAPVNENGNIIASKISQDFGYIYNTPDTVLLTSDKSFYDKILKEAGLKRLKTFYKKNEINDIKFPVIVKPTQSTSSKGVTLLESDTNLDMAIDYAKANSRTGKIIIEEYIKGIQFSIETISFKGEHQIVGVVEEHLSKPPVFFERSDYLDMELQFNYIEKFNNYIVKLLSAFNVQTGPCHVEVRIKNSDIYLIDFASRSGGWRDIMLHFSGINYNQLILDSYLGNKININNYKIKFSVGAGILMYKKDKNQYNKAKNSSYFIADYFNSNKPQSNPRSLAQAYGYYFIKGRNRNNLSNLLPVKIN